MENKTEPTEKRIDMHVHIVGNGTGGTGCRMRVTGWHRPLAAFMLKHIGLPSSALNGDLDTLYLNRLLELVRNSSLSQVVILAHEEVRDEMGRVMEGVGSLYVPNDYVLNLARLHPEFLPAVSIHPARPDAIEELERCLAAGAVMMKCLPNCQNIDCNNPKYRTFWERMAEAGLPLLAHTGGEHTVPVVRKEFADPRTLELPLQCGVTVIAAHSATKSGLFDPDYFEVFADMIRQYPRFYGDNSAFNTPLRGSHIPDCLKNPIAERIVHGSDFPVPTYGKWAWLRGLLSYSEMKKLESNPNILERDYQIKKALGFDSASFTRVSSLLRKTK